MTTQAPSLPITHEQLRTKIMRHEHTTRPAASAGVPLGLHCFPTRNNGREHWYAIGAVAWGDEGKSVNYFDLRLTDDQYDAVNQMLRDVCAELRIPYINMR
jgi:hypothetical protein